MGSARRLFCAALLGSAALLPLSSGASFGQGTPHLVIATNAGAPAKTWRNVVAGPYTKATGVPVDIFECPLASTVVAQSTGHPTFNAAMVPYYAVPHLLETGKLEELTPEDIPGVKAIPERFWVLAPDGKLAGMPLFFSLYGIAYNTDMAKASDFDSWLNLLQPRFKGQISVTRPYLLAAYDLNMFAKLAGGDENNVEPGYKLIGELTNNALSVYTTMASLNSQLARGEVIAAPFYSAEVVSMKREGITNVEFMTPREGGMIVPQVMVIPKGAPDLDATKKLVSSMPEAQYQIGFAQAQWAWPMNPSVVLPDDLRKQMGGTSAEVMARNYSPDWFVVGAHLEERTHRIEQIINH